MLSEMNRRLETVQLPLGRLHRFPDHPLYYRVVAFIDLLSGLCYNAEDAVDR